MQIPFRFTPLVGFYSLGKDLQRCCTCKGHYTCETRMSNMSELYRRVIPNNNFCCKNQHISSTMKTNITLRLFPMSTF